MGAREKRALGAVLVIAILLLSAPELYDLSLDIANQVVLQRYGWKLKVNRSRGVAAIISPEIDGGAYDSAFEAAGKMGMNPRAYLNRPVRRYVYTLDHPDLADVVTAEIWRSESKVVFAYVMLVDLQWLPPEALRTWPLNASQSEIRSLLQGSRTKDGPAAY